MAKYNELEVSFTSMIDQILIYHREACIDMHVNADVEEREKLYHKAEAAREVIVLLAKGVLTKNELKLFQAAIQERLESVFQAMFFHKDTRNQIIQAKENRNGGES